MLIKHFNNKTSFFFKALLLTVIISSCKSPSTNIKDNASQNSEKIEITDTETWHPPKSEPNVNDIRLQAWEQWSVVPIYNVFTQENGNCTLQTYVGITNNVAVGTNLKYVQMFPNKQSTKYGIPVGEPKGITDCNQKSYVEDVNYNERMFMADQNDKRISSERPVVMYNIFISN